MSDHIDKLAIDTIRTLSMDAVQKANSGHPGTPMALAPLMYTLWQNHLRYDPANPLWPGRDRFVLSAGHASMLLYATLHLAQVRQLDANRNPSDKPAVSLEEIERFRQLGSKTPGHPEYGVTTGVELTTGPLGQGVGMSVGLAIAEKWRAAHFNRPNFALFDYRIWVICSDGDLMEGISNEAASLAGHLRLDNLVWIYDQNHISIEGPTNIAFDEDVATRFQGYGWGVLHVPDANDTAAIDEALSVAAAAKGSPTLIIVRSHIGYGAPHKQDTKEAHGEALGDSEVAAAKRAYGWPADKTFYVPDGVKERFAQGLGARGAQLFAAWQDLASRYRDEYSDLAREAEHMRARTLPGGWDSDIETFPADDKGAATRDSGGKVMNAIAAHVPWLVGGAADLAPSTKTEIRNSGSIEADSFSGRNMHFGVREHVMGAIVNGMTLSGLRGLGATFLIFSDYMRPAIRLSALMEIPSIFIFTHDSIGLGEDGPTHQPIEQLVSLRAIPHMRVIRPCDANEVAEAWRIIMGMNDRPACLVLSRQKLPTLNRSKYGSAKGVAKGAYVLADAQGGKPEAIVIATGSEVQLALQARETLVRDGVRVRVVSMPSWELFDAQPANYRDSVLPPDIEARVSIEAGSTVGWERYVGRGGAMIGMHGFGASAPAPDVYRHFGITAQAVQKAVREQLARKAGNA
ncbi:MAG TPA: transketolase [Rhizomicrobium sp.]|jgi:transketolase|nr:transketolase [Rhizomicrobium sp.]